MQPSREVEALSWHQGRNKPRVCESVTGCEPADRDTSLPLINSQNPFAPLFLAFLRRTHTPIVYCISPKSVSTSAACEHTSLALSVARGMMIDISLYKTPREPHLPILKFIVKDSFFTARARATSYECEKRCLLVVGTNGITHGFNKSINTPTQCRPGSLVHGHVCFSFGGHGHRQTKK